MGCSAAALPVPQLLAIGRITETVGDVQFGVQREQQRQPRMRAGIDILLKAGIPPCAAQAGVVLPIRT